MDTRRPHTIIPERELDLDNPKTKARFMPLSPDEAELLSTMTSDQRHAWLKDKLPTKERLARHLEAEGLPTLAYNARQGRYDDFDEGGADTPQLALLQALKFYNRYDLSWIVTSGEYDATKAESDAWAKRQTGESGALCDRLGLR